VSPATFAQVIAVAKPSAVYLNSCNSIGTATLLRDSLSGVSVVTTISDIDDEEAYISGSIFAKAMVESGGNVEASYESSRRKHSANYVLLKGGRQVSDYPYMIESGQLLNAILDLGRQVEKNDQRMIYVTSTFAATSDQIKQINTKIDSLSKEESTDAPVSWLFGYILFALSVFMIMGSYDFFSLLSPVQKSATAVFLQLLSLGLFAYGLGWIKFKGIQ
jgi:hypothetical protein